MDEQACLSYLQTHCRKGQPGGYARTVRMAALLGNPQEKLRTIHIAGTNGKGSTAAMLEAVLRQAGYRVGLFTSPHLERYEERIQINRQPIAAIEFAALLTQLIEKVVPQLLREGMDHPGEFELLTVAGWMYFAEKTDFVISEVGLGGTLDPTNVIQHPLLTVLTTISLDHCQILGNTIAQIAREKAGIIKLGVPVVSAPQMLEAEMVIQQIAQEKQAPLHLLRQDALQLVATNLQGGYQQINSNTALAAVQVLREQGLVQVTDAQIATALQQVDWPGRMEYVPLEHGRGILLDGAHNPDGVARLVENLQQLYREREIFFLLSILDDKAQLEMLRQLLPLAAGVVLTRPAQQTRAQHWRDLETEIAQLAPDCACTVFDDYEQALRWAIAHLRPNQLLCITGSLYLLGDCRHLLRTVLS